MYECRDFYCLTLIKELKANERNLFFFHTLSSNWNCDKINDKYNDPYFSSRERRIDFCKAQT